MGCSKATGGPGTGVVWGHMRRTPRLAGPCPRLLVILAAALPAVVHAQGGGRNAVGASVGPVVPLGTLGQVADPGIRGGLWLESGSVSGAAGRLEASLDHFTADRAPPAGGRAGVSIYSLTANVVTTGGRNRAVPGRVRAYVIGGLGIYATRTSVGGVFGGVAGPMQSRGRVGVNGGGGVRLPIGALQLVAEARFHLLLSGAGYGSRNTGYLPLVLGLRF